MVNPSRRKGTPHENRVVAYLQEHGFPDAERRALAGAKDRGDVAGVGCALGRVVVEAKNEKRVDLAGYMDEVRVEKKNDGAAIGFAVMPRRNCGIERAYVVFELADVVALLRGATEQ